MPRSTIFQNLVGGTSVSDSRIANLSDSVNMFVERQGTGASAESVLRSIYGSSPVIELPKGKCRGLHVVQRNWMDLQSVYAVFGNTLYVIWKDEEGNYAYAQLVDVFDAIEEVSMVENGAETVDESYLFVADGQNVIAIPRRVEPDRQRTELFSLNIPYKVNSTSDRIKPRHLAYCYNYLVCNDGGSGAFYTSYQYPLERTKDGEIDRDVFQLAKYGETGFVTYAEWSTDTITNIVTNGTYLYVFGMDSTQIFTWQNSVDAPFVSPTNSANGIGLKAEHSVAVNADTIFWLGGSRVGENAVYSIVGNAVSKVSTPDIDRALMGLGDKSDAIGQCWTECGHLFYALTFMQDDVTYVYDATEKLWHRRSSIDDVTTAQHHWYQKWACIYDGRIHFGTDDGMLVVMDPKAYTDYRGRPIVKKRISGAVINSYHHFCIDEIDLVCNCGEVSDPNIVPRIIMRYADDGGAWSNPMMAYLGRTGEYSNRVSFWNLGAFRVCMIELTCSENIPLMILGADIKFSELDW